MYASVEILFCINYLCTSDYTAPCIMFWMRASAYPLRGQARCHFTGLKKLSIFRVQPPPPCPSAQEAFKVGFRAHTLRSGGAGK
jgi:hypothetical protein